MGLYKNYCVLVQLAAAYFLFGSYFFHAANLFGTPAEKLSGRSFFGFLKPTSNCGAPREKDEDVTCEMEAEAAEV